MKFSKFVDALGYCMRLCIVSFRLMFVHHVTVPQELLGRSFRYGAMGMSHSCFPLSTVFLRSSSKQPGFLGTPQHLEQSKRTSDGPAAPWMIQTHPERSSRTLDESTASCVIQAQCRRFKTIWVHSWPSWRIPNNPSAPQTVRPYPR